MYTCLSVRFDSQCTSGFLANSSLPRRFTEGVKYKTFGRSSTLHPLQPSHLDSLVLKSLVQALLERLLLVKLPELFPFILGRLVSSSGSAASKRAKRNLVIQRS